MPNIDVTVDALVLVEWSGALREGDGAWHADVRCAVAPYQNGLRVLGTELRQLELLGLQTRYAATLDYSGTTAPTVAHVGADMLQWIGATHAAASADWVGKRFVAAEHPPEGT